MRNVQRTMVVAALASLAVAAVTAPGAVAKPKPRLAVKVAPAKPTLKTPITVSFKAPKAPKGTIWSVELQIDGGLNGAGSLACTNYPFSRSSRARSGRAATVTFRPSTDNPSATGNGVWCPGTGRITVTRSEPHRTSYVVIARRSFTVALGPGEAEPPQSFVPVKITALGGSTLTASASGRADRSAQLTGILRGSIPGRFKPNTDVNVEQISGSLTPLGAAPAQAVFPPDPLCPDTMPPGTFDVLPSSQLLLKASGQGIFTLVMNGAASQLFGCGPAGALNSTTTLPLSGQVGPKGLLEMPEAGAVTGIPLPGGSQGGLAANLVLNVDLSGKG